MACLWELEERAEKELTQNYLKEKLKHLREPWSGVGVRTASTENLREALSR